MFKVVQGNLCGMTVNVINQILKIKKLNDKISGCLYANFAYFFITYNREIDPRKWPLLSSVDINSVYLTYKYFVLVRCIWVLFEPILV